jgi:hypothetical protein
MPELRCIETLSKLVFEQAFGEPEGVSPMALTLAWKVGWVSDPTP